MRLWARGFNNNINNLIQQHSARNNTARAQGDYYLTTIVLISPYGSNDLLIRFTHSAVRQLERQLLTIQG